MYQNIFKKVIVLYEFVNRYIMKTVKTELQKKISED